MVYFSQMHYEQDPPLHIVNPPMKKLVSNFSVKEYYIIMCATDEATSRVWGYLGVWGTLSSEH